MPSRTSGSIAPSRAGAILTARGKVAAISARERVEPVRVDEIGLVEHDEVGAQELVLVDFLERIVVVERRVGHALRGDARGIVGEAALGDGRRVDDRDHAVDREPGAQLRPVERLDQRLRQREPGGLDDDVVGLRLAREQRLDRRREIVGDGAADAAIGKLDDRLFRAGRVGAALQEIAVDADVAEFVDDEREPPPAGVRQQMADQRRLAGAEKAGDDGDGRLGEHAGPILKRAKLRRARAAACARRRPCGTRAAVRARERFRRAKRRSGARRSRCPRDALRA